MPCCACERPWGKRPCASMSSGTTISSTVAPVGNPDADEVGAAAGGEAVGMGKRVGAALVGVEPSGVELSGVELAGVESAVGAAEDCAPAACPAVCDCAGELPIGARHVGHELCIRNHRSTHPTWKVWPQGRRRTRCPSSNASMHTLQGFSKFENVSR